MNNSLTATRRQQEIERLADGEVVDVLVIGAGVTGAGVALDAASRGLSVALVEAQDLAFGTSRWSSKLVHGGLRYLATGDVGLAWESARERRVLMERTAPHLVRPLPFVLPLTAAAGLRGELLVRAALRTGDVLRMASGMSRRALPGPRRLSATETTGLAPALSATGLRGGLLSWDGQLVDDARLVVALARTAAAHGARVLTHCRVTAVDAGAVTATDVLSGTELTLRARHVVNATGVWADRLDPSVALTPSRGSHLVLRSSALAELTTGLMLPVPGEHNRFLLALPQPDGPVYLGLTDEPVTGPTPDVADVPASDEQFLLSVASTMLAAPLTAADVVGRFAGLRPLLAGRGHRSADLSRKHAILEGPRGLLTVTGGKLTTYRAMAQQVVDRLTDRPCRTTTLPLVGAGPRSGDAPARLVRRYGAEAPVVAALAQGREHLLQPVADGVPTLGVELAFAVEHEGALTVADVVERRTRLSLIPEHAEAARPLAEELLSQSEAVPAADRRSPQR